MHGDNSDIILKKKYSYKACTTLEKVEWAFDSIQNPMGVATYEGIKIKDKLPSVEDLKNALTWWSRSSENIKRMRRLLQRKEITHPIKKQNSCIILYFYALDNSYLYQHDINY